MLKASLDSILTVFDRGVIAYNECTDGSDEIIEEFCRENKGFIPYCYPYAVEPAGSKKYATGELKEENTLSGYYNAVMDKIPKGVWVMKIDVDHIYLKEALRYSFTLPKKRKDIVIYSKLNCVRDSRGKIKVFSYVRPGDQWLLYNDNLRFKMNCGFDDFGNFFAYEHLSLKGRNVPYMPECPSVHFPFEKNSRSFKGKIEELVDIDEYIRDADGFEISDDLLMVKEVMRKIEL